MLRHVLADGEVTGGEGLAWHNLWDLGGCLGGDVLDGRRRNTAGGEEGRRPRRRASVPGEGPANTGNQCAQEHQGEIRIRFPYLIWPRK
jgi:hypothetical protein